MLSGATFQQQSSGCGLILVQAVTTDCMVLGEMLIGKVYSYKEKRQQSAQMVTSLVMCLVLKVRSLL